MKTKPVNRRVPAADRPPAKLWQLCLYVAGQTSKSLRAFANLNRFCEEHLKGCYHITVIDLVEEPRRARSDQIFAIPTVVRRAPKPERIIIGDFSDAERLLLRLELTATD